MHDVLYSLADGRFNYYDIRVLQFLLGLLNTFRTLRYDNYRSHVLLMFARKSFPSNFILRRAVVGFGEVIGKKKYGGKYRICKHLVSISRSENFLC